MSDRQVTYNRVPLMIDVDGVLANFTRGYIDVINAVYPEKKVPKDYVPQDWDHTDILKKDEVPALWLEIKNGDLRRCQCFWYELPPYEENVEILSKFITDDIPLKRFVIYYITSRPDTQYYSALDQTRKWLRRHNLIWTNTSVLVVRNPQEKLPLIRALGIVASIDDYAPTVRALDTIPNHFACLLERPWNQDATDITECMRAKDLQNFLEACVKDYELLYEIANGGVLVPAGAKKAPVPPITANREPLPL